MSLSTASVVTRGGGIENRKRSQSQLFIASRVMNSYLSKLMFRFNQKSAICLIPLVLTLSIVVLVVALLLRPL